MIPLPSKPKIIEKKGENLGIFEIEGLYPGYGVTIGNSLRRTLLSSLEGAAVTRVKIKGVQHEFSTIDGVLEDVIVICQNLKKLRFKIYTSEPQKATLKVKGEKEVKGQDLELPSQVELVNPQAHIATLTSKNASLEMEIQIEKGIGYVPVEQRKEEKLAIGEIQLDAIFTPIKRVAFHVENMRVGKRTDFNRLRIEIETDGTISPEEALAKASDILTKHFSMISEEFSKPEKAQEKKEQSSPAPAEIKIEDLGISSRTISVLSQNNIKTLAGLLRKKEKDLLEMKGMGEKGVEEIKKALKKLGFELKK
ncbi:DNA-directed RNA polymerase subunit alpha [bacterium]|nr:DNA-directed RNA polymerase subunit alpha [bacterium]